MTYLLQGPEGLLSGRIQLTGSKSIANRALIIQALSPQSFPIERLAAADDTQRLQAILQSDDTILDVGPAGTTYRFLTAYLCRKPGYQTLTGSKRMLERPIGILVDALRELGADISYLGEEGYPPLKIGYTELDRTYQLKISASTSSQFISALLLLAPTLPNGLEIELEGKLVSRPYIEMTLALMARFGASYDWPEESNIIRVNPGTYAGPNLAADSTITPFVVEADWSAASYYYSLAAIAPEADLQIDGLFADSLQGDSAVVNIYRAFGVESHFNATGLRIVKTRGSTNPPLLEKDFLKCPDIAQTVAVSCAATGVQGLYTGLETLFIKETDRVAALKTELAKVGVFLSKLPPRLAGKSGTTYYLQEGQASFATPSTFATYHDHRMAMAFAPLALLGPIKIEDPMVVIKSYPDFYQDLGLLGFQVTEV
ncbi:MAG: 3-phosphoshikimate 1-carboxyvinyltransferase [Bacteroidota bacterium]